MIAEYKRETRSVSLTAITALVLLSSIVLTNAVGSPYWRDPHHPSIPQTQLQPGIYTISCTAKVPGTHGHGEGFLEIEITEEKLKWSHYGSHTSNVPDVALGSMSLYSLSEPRDLFHFPLQAGTQWQTAWQGFSASCTLSKANKTTRVQGGEFTNCLVQTTLIKQAEGESPDEYYKDRADSYVGKRKIWFASGVGIVRMEYQHSTGSLSVMELVDYDIPGSSREYLPTIHGSRWTYHKHNDLDPRMMEENWVLTQIPHFSHQDRTRRKQPTNPRSEHKSNGPSIDMKLVQILSNNCKERVRIIAIAQTENGKHMARGDFSINPHDGLSFIEGGTYGHGECPGDYMLVPYVLRTKNKLFQLPIQHGVSWTQSSDSASIMKTTITGNETINTPAGELRCLKHISEISGAHTNKARHNAYINGTRTLWFAPGIGLTKMEYSHSDGATTIAELTKYQTNQNNQAYWPLDPGNTWTYKWHNKYMSTPIIETITVPKSGDLVHIWVKGGETRGQDWRLVTN